MDIRIVQYLDLRVRRVSGGTRLHRYQNYFIGQTDTLAGNDYSFAPFQVSGTTAALGGENQTLQILFPHTDYALVLVEEGSGNRLSELTLITRWLTAQGNTLREPTQEFFVGMGASFSDTTIELRFRTALDSAGSEFPARKLTREVVGPLPLNAELFLR